MVRLLKDTHHMTAAVGATHQAAMFQPFCGEVKERSSIGVGEAIKMPCTIHYRRSRRQGMLHMTCEELSRFLHLVEVLLHFLREILPQPVQDGHLRRIHELQLQFCTKPM